MKRLFLILAAGVLIAGCNKPAADSAGEAPAAKYRIAVIPKGANHVFWRSVHAGAMEAGDEIGEISVDFKGPISEGDIANQIEIFESFLADGYDAICLAPTDKNALQKPVEQAIAAGVPVVIFDSGLASHEGIVSYVATDNYAGGKQAGEKLAELLGGEGKVILLRYELGSESTEQREKGFLDALGEHAGIELISDNQYAGPDEAGAIEKAEFLLNEFGEQVDGIFCPNESSASGMLTVLRKHPLMLAGKVKFVGFDAGQNIIQGLEDGHLQATVLQDPVTMGREAVKAAYAALQKEPVEPQIVVPGGLATPENMDEPRIHKLLNPVQAE